MSYCSKGSLAWFKSDRVIFTILVRQWRVISPIHSCEPRVGSPEICKAESAENEPCRQFSLLRHQNLMRMIIDGAGIDYSHYRYNYAHINPSQIKPCVNLHEQ
jgi:hypothetical protein